MENQKIEMKTSDHLNEDGEIVLKAKQIGIASRSALSFSVTSLIITDLGILKYPILQKLEIKNIKAHFIHTDYETASRFVSSDEDLNGIRRYDCIYFEMLAWVVGLSIASHTSD